MQNKWPYSIRFNVAPSVRGCKNRLSKRPAADLTTGLLAVLLTDHNPHAHQAGTLGFWVKI